MKPAIIIFGAAVRRDGMPSGAMRNRVEAALACAAQLEDPLFVPTGARGRYGAAEAEVMREILVASGVTPNSVLTELTGTNTFRSVLGCVRLLRGQVGRVYVATSAYHLPRCLLLLRVAGLRARPCRPPRAPASNSRLKRWLWRLREVPAAPVDCGLMLWFRLMGRL